MACCPAREQSVTLMSPEAMHMRQALPKSYIASFKLSPIRGDEWKSPSAWPSATKNAVVGLSRSVCRETVGFDPQAVVGCDQAPIYSLGHLLARHYTGRLPVAGP
jgi:hypothetical protein